MVIHYPKMHSPPVSWSPLLGQQVSDHLLGRRVLLVPSPAWRLGLSAPPGGSTRRQKRLAPWTQVCSSGGALSFIVFPFRVPVLFPASSNPSTFYSFPNQPCGFFVFVLSYGHVLVLVLSRSVAPDSLRARGL